MSYKIAASNPLQLSADALAFMEKRIDYAAGTSPVYVGYTKQPSADVDAAVWFIIKLTNDGNGNPTYVQLPDEGVKFGYDWTNRANHFS